MRECPRKIVPRLSGYCGRAVDSIISVFTKLDRSGFNLEFETFSGQSDTWLPIYGRGKAKLAVTSKTALLLFSGNFKDINKVSFQRKGSGIE